MRYYFIEPFDLHTFPDDGSQDEYITPDMRPITSAEADTIRAAASAAQAAAHYDYKALRAAAFRAEADPIYFQIQRAEASQADWLAKVTEIRARYPEQYVPPAPPQV